MFPYFASCKSHEEKSTPVSEPEINKKANRAPLDYYVTSKIHLQKIISLASLAPSPVLLLFRKRNLCREECIRYGMQAVCLISTITLRKAFLN
jgi:hypothetical protein